MAIEDLIDNQYAELSFRNIKRDPNISLLALHKHYIQRGVNLKDPIINNALSRASIGLSQGHITDDSVFKAINFYHSEYQEELQNSTIREILTTIAQTGYGETKYHPFPGELMQYINSTYAQLHQMAQDNRNAETTIKAIKAIDILENQKFETIKTDILLETLYPRQQREKREKQK